MKAMKFASHVLGKYGARDCLRSTGMIGESGVKLADLLEHREARSLTVEGVILLHQICNNDETELRKRGIASHALLILYGRCKVSDVTMIQEVKHYPRQTDAATSMTCLIRCGSMLVDGERLTDSRPYSLPIMISGESVCEPGWHELCRCLKWCIATYPQREWMG